MASATGYEFETLRVTVPSEYVYHVEINRPEKRNAMNKAFWSDILTCFNKISADGNCRSVVLSGAGKLFSSGIDLQYLISEFSGYGGETDIARRAFFIRKLVPAFQEAVTIMEKCTKPVITAVHGACIGAAVDLICATDIRYCSQDAWFQIKEVDIGITADVGTLQRLPKIVGNDSLVRELCYTARQIKSDEALNFGLVSRILPDKDAMLAGALETAKLIASKSPVAVQGTKIALVYARDHSVADALEQVATLNQSMLQSEDLVKAATAALTKEPVTFSKL
jgi:delta(3,5)-delta(2,4)-dienoyl-CoA isomerase